MTEVPLKAKITKITRKGFFLYFFMVFFVIIKSVEGKLGILVNVNIITKNG